MMDLEKEIHNYTSTIDGLRAIAVIVVIINHFNESVLPSGFLGVDVFFVISGFVITSSLLYRKETSIRAYIFGFYKRRVKRLFPALIFCFTIGALLISFFNSEPRKHILTGLLSIPGLSNLYLFKDSVDYWSQSAKLNPFTHTWSLGVEEQFYMIYPLMLIFLVRKSWISTNIIQATKILALVCGFSLMGYLWLSPLNIEMTYFLIPFRFWEMGLGCLLFLSLLVLPETFKSITSRLNSGILFFFLLGVFFIPNFWPYLTTVLAVLITVLLIARLKYNDLFKISEKYGATALLSTDFMQYIGKISYSLYLWHWIVIVISKWTVGIRSDTIPFQIILILLFAMFSYHFLEKPMRLASWFSSFRIKVVLSVFALSIVFWTYATIDNSLERKLYLGSNGAIDQNFSGLFKEFDSKVNSVRVLGNSHSLHLLPMLSKLTERYRINLIYDRHGDYTLIPNGDYSDIGKLESVLSELGDNDLIIVSTRMALLYEYPYYNDGISNRKDYSFEKEESGYGLSVWLKELDMLISAAEKKGVSVVLILPLVEFDKPIPINTICEEEWFRTPCEDCNPSISREFLNKRFPKAFFEEVKKRASNEKNFYLFDAMPIYCPDKSEECHRVVENIVAYRDSNHLSSKGSLLMLEEFYDFLVEKNLL